jgi:hypothetical protein
MSTRGIDFANEWVRENVNASSYAEDGKQHSETQAAVEQLLADAAKAGITREEIEEDMGDLDDFVDNAFEESADAEVQRMADKDPY